MTVNLLKLFVYYGDYLYLCRRHIISGIERLYYEEEDLPWHDC